MRKEDACLVVLLLAVGLASGADEDGDIDKLIADFFNVTTAATPVRVEASEPPPPPPQPPVGETGYNPPPPPPPGGTDDSDCECVPYYLCVNNSIVDNGVGIIDIRIRECDSYLDICCKTPSPPTQPVVVPTPKVHTSCGIRNIDGVGFRITGGVNNEAQFGELPWMVAILREEVLEDLTKLHVYQCGGALIHPNVVMTAAHCVAGRAPGLLRTRAGEWDTQTKNELLPFQDRTVSKVIIHERYYAGALYNDIALLIVNEPFEFEGNVNIVCLPKQNDVVLSKDCIASGWGKDKYGKEGNYQVILKKVDLPMVPRDRCIDALRRTRLGQHFKLHESFVCAGGELGKDTCKGDGGGPLVCPVPGKQLQYQQVGMIAWGIGCGQEDVPAVYVNVAMFRNWIDAHMAKLGYTIGYSY